MSTPRVTEVETVEVGRFYNVPHGFVDRSRVPGEYLPIGWLPLLGPAHDDAAILGFPVEHFHYDWRFVPEVMTRRMERRTAPLLANIETTRAVLRVEWKRRKCLRTMPIFPVPMGRVGFPLDKLEDAFAGAKLKPDCRACPHRGVPLNGLPVDGGRVVVCPGHGLAWNLDTSALMRRASKAAP